MMYREAYDTYYKIVTCESNQNFANILIYAIIDINLKFAPYPLYYDPLSKSLKSLIAQAQVISNEFNLASEFDKFCDTFRYIIENDVTLDNPVTFSYLNNNIKYLNIGIRCMLACLYSGKTFEIISGSVTLSKETQDKMIKLLADYLGVAFHISYNNQEQIIIPLQITSPKIVMVYKNNFYYLYSYFEKND